MFKRNVKINHPWEGRILPFRIIGNVYFTGTYQASSHLIDTGDGLILIDTGYANALYLVLDSIRRLGFDIDDIRYLVHTHWHYDHTEATEYLLPLIPGAKTVIGRNDADEVIRAGYFVPDMTVKDGDVLTLGKTSIRFLETPGHTKGTVSLFFDAEEAGRIYRVGMFGGAGRNTLTKEYLKTYPTCRTDYRESLVRLKKERVDVMLGNHTWNNDTDAKGKAFLADPTQNPFIDETLFGKFLDFCAGKLDELEEKEREKSVNSEFAGDHGSVIA